jgi:putative effector of murein hydrolase
MDRISKYLFPVILTLMILDSNKEINNRVRKKMIFNSILISIPLIRPITPHHPLRYKEFRKSRSKIKESRETKMMMNSMMDGKM